jgi:pyruvate/2-oxoglutarate/acetoin dehydrogenase E1 component
MSVYFDELCHAMESLARLPNIEFIGQGVGIAGTTLTDSFKNVPKEKLLEFPVAEDLQMGACIGMALDGILPICIFPRWNFMLCAANQIVNHLDRLPIYSDGGYNPRVIIRVASPRVPGFDPGPQHDDDLGDAFRLMLRTVKVVRLGAAEEIMPEYQRAAEAPHSTILVEYTALYGAVPSGVKA